MTDLLPFLLVLLAADLLASAAVVAVGWLLRHKLRLPKPPDDTP